METKLYQFYGIGDARIDRVGCVSAQTLAPNAPGNRIPLSTEDHR